MPAPAAPLPRRLAGRHRGRRRARSPCCSPSRSRRRRGSTRSWSGPAPWSAHWSPAGSGRSPPSSPSRPGAAGRGSRSRRRCAAWCWPRAASPWSPGWPRRPAPPRRAATRPQTAVDRRRRRPSPASRSRTGRTAAGSAAGGVAGGPQRVTVRPGDTLWDLAADHLGSGDRWPAIYALNRAVIGADPDLIQPAQRLRLPAEGDPMNAERPSPAARPGRERPGHARARPPAAARPAGAGRCSRTTRPRT